MKTIANIFLISYGIFILSRISYNIWCKIQFAKTMPLFETIMIEPYLIIYLILFRQG